MDTDSGIKLVKELKQNKLLPSFNEALLSELAKQITGQYVYLTEDFAAARKEAQQNADEDYDEDADAALPLAVKVAMERNVRCSLAYM